MTPKTGSIWFQCKRFFFDQAQVRAVLGMAQARALAQTGAWIRSVAQRSMRYRSIYNYAPAGQPPHAHEKTGAMLRHLVAFGYGRQGTSVVVGPLRFKSKANWCVPAVHEKGFSGTRRMRNRDWRVYKLGHAGPIRAATVFGWGAPMPGARDLVPVGVGAVWARLSTPAMVDRAMALRPTLFGPEFQERKVRYLPRPFMWPALEKAIVENVPSRFLAEAIQYYARSVGQVASYRAA